MEKRLIELFELFRDLKQDVKFESVPHFEWLQGVAFANIYITSCFAFRPKLERYCVDMLK